MFYVDLNYLKKVGLYFDKESGTIKLRDYSSYKYPTLSCRLKDGWDTSVSENESGNGNFVFVLSYFVSDDFNKQQIEFSFEDWQQSGKDGEAFKVLRSSGFFQYFSITNSLIMSVFSSRLKGRKAWKKRSWQLPLKNAQVLEAFGVDPKLLKKDKKFSVDEMKIVQNITELDEIMRKCIIRSARDFSYMPFDLYFDSYKKKLFLQSVISAPLLTR